MECRENIEKYLLISINGLYTIISLLCLFCGVWILSDYNWLENLQLYNAPSYLRELIGIVFLASGILSTVLYLGGLWGALKEISSLLKVYSWILVFCLILSLIDMILMYNMFDIEKFPFIEALFKNYNYKDEPANSVVDFIQEAFACCGYNGPEDHQTSMFGRYPKSCCNPSTEYCNIPFTKGCSDRLSEVAANWKIFIIVTTAVTAVFHIVCIVSAFRLASKAEKKNAAAPLYNKM